MDEERREFKRVPFQTRIRYRKLEAKGAYAESSPEQANLSVGGVFVPTKFPVPRGQMVELEWSLPNRHDKVAVIGKVAWVGEWDGIAGMGVEFIKLDPQIRDDIIRYSRRGQWQDSSEQHPAVPPQHDDKRREVL